MFIFIFTAWRSDFYAANVYIVVLSICFILQYLECSSREGGEDWVVSAVDPGDMTRAFSCEEGKKVKMKRDLDIEIDSGDMTSERCGRHLFYF